MHSDRSPTTRLWRKREFIATERVKPVIRRGGELPALLPRWAQPLRKQWSASKTSVLQPQAPSSLGPEQGDHHDICVYVFEDICRHIYISHLHTHIYIHTQTHTRTPTPTQTHTPTRMHTHTNTHTHIHTCIHACRPSCMNAYMHTCKHTDIHADYEED